MKIFFRLSLLVGFCYGVDDRKASGNYWRRFKNDAVYRDVKNDDNSERAYRSDPIFRPCALDDINCIRRVFAHNSRCTPAEGLIPDTYKIEREYLNIPQANLTFILDNSEYRGLSNWKINEFYLNKATDKLVLEVVFARIVLSSPKTTLRFYRKGKEPIETTDYAIIEHNDVSLTLTIPNIRNIQLSQGQVYADLPTGAPTNSIGSEVYNSKDPVVNLALTELIRNVGISIREGFVTQGPVIMALFIQSTICDFGYQPDA